ncbi:MAG: NAD(P)H-hydrate dehydratase [Actinobacteria bacterium]|nr:NAD(P)H-hydrate dehydratase [Actinomycetota bacterium]
MDAKIILKGSRVAEVDAKCIADGIDSKWLMQNAGSSVAAEIIKDYRRFLNTKIIKGVTVSGGGNNGGDGFAAAADLAAAGMIIDVFYIRPPERFSGDSKFYFDRLPGSKVENIRFIDFSIPEDKETFINKVSSSDFVVDAIFGTGLHKEDVRGQAKDIINSINAIKNGRKNSAPLSVYSCDIPSGVDSDDGRILGCAIRADKTVTFGCIKKGIAEYPGKDFAGTVIVSDIGIPFEYFDKYEKIYQPDLFWVAQKIPLKKPWTYKHAVGKLLVIAGSPGFTGAAVMTCQAAMKAGAGIVTLICPWELNSIFEIKLTEVMTYPVEQTDDITLDMDAYEDIEKFAQNYDALAVGPGLSRNPSTICLVREILKNIKKPTVLDADGLRALYGPMEIGSETDLDLSHLIITPHAGELASILGTEKIPLEERLEHNKKVVEKYGLVSVLKGASTLITEPGGTTFINPTGSWALATAGTGDILTGITGSLLAQKMSLFDAAVSAVFIHGMASDIMAKKTGRTSQVATDLLEGIKKVFVKIEKIKY